jgi:CBS domain-containing protein
MKCSDVMTKNPVCCTASDHVSTAAQLMSQEDIGSLPIVSPEQNRKLIGIVTDRDLALRVVGENLDPVDTRVMDVMTGNPITCRPDDDLDDMLNAMSRHQIRRVPVVNTMGQVVGIIAQADIALRTPNDRKTAEVIGDISRPNGNGGM